MDNIDKHFKGQQEYEYIACFCRKHWVSLAPLGLEMLLFAILTGTVAYVLTFLENELLIQGTILIGVAVATFFLHQFALRLINYFLELLVITNHRVITLKKTLFLHDDRDAIDLAKMQDVIKTQSGLIKNILGYGEITITLSGASITKRVTHIPNPEYHFRKINELKREYIIKRTEEKQKFNQVAREKRAEGLDMTEKTEDSMASEESG